MSEFSSQQAACDEGAASPQPQEAVAKLRAALERYDDPGGGMLAAPADPEPVLEAAREVLAALNANWSRGPKRGGRKS